MTVAGNRAASVSKRIMDIWRSYLQEFQFKVLKTIFTVSFMLKFSPSFFFQLIQLNLPYRAQFPCLPFHLKCVWCLLIEFSGVNIVFLAFNWWHCWGIPNSVFYFFHLFLLNLRCSLRLTIKGFVFSLFVVFVFILF